MCKNTSFPKNLILAFCIKMSKNYLMTGNIATATKLLHKIKCIQDSFICINSS